MFKLVWPTAALGAAMIASPAISDSPNLDAKRAAQPVKQSSTMPSGTIPAAVLVAGAFLVTIANRRRNPQSVLC